jgi:hypothetical protein
MQTVAIVRDPSAAASGGRERGFEDAQVRRRNRRSDGHQVGDPDVVARGTLSAAR